MWGMLQGHPLRVGYSVSCRTGSRTTSSTDSAGKRSSSDNRSLVSPKLWILLLFVVFFHSYFSASDLIRANSVTPAPHEMGTRQPDGGVPTARLTCPDSTNADADTNPANTSSEPVSATAEVSWSRSWSAPLSLKLIGGRGKLLSVLSKRDIQTWQGPWIVWISVPLASIPASLSIDKHWLAVLNRFIVRSVGEVTRADRRWWKRR